MKNLFKRRVTKILLGTILVLVAGFFIWREWRLASIPDVGEPFDVEEYLAQTGDGEEIARITGEAAQEWDTLWENQEEKWFIFYDLPKKVWSEVDPVLRRDVTQAEPILEKWFQVNELEPGLLSSPQELNLMTWIPAAHHQHLRELTRLSEYYITEQIHRGESAKSHQTCVHFLRANSRYRYDSKTCYLVAVACYAELFDKTLLPYLNQSQITAEQLRELKLALEQHQQNQPPYSHYLKYDYLEYQAMLEEMLNEVSPWWGDFIYEKEVVQRLHNLVYQNWLSHFDDHPEERPDIKTYEFTSYRFPESYDDWDLKSEHTVQYFSCPQEEHLISALKSPSFSESVVAESFGNDLDLFFSVRQRQQCREDLTVTTVALHLYYREHNRFPETLQELIPTYLTKLPHNPGEAGSLVDYHLEGENAVLMPEVVHYQRTIQPPGSELKEPVKF
ncbi:MAG: hypothetical protein KDA65_00510 [Planctomycetaceae bacterium]|nr:hypothetical protein [Planctomycetaceae bacterium]